MRRQPTIGRSLWTAAAAGAAAITLMTIGAGAHVTAAVLAHVTARATATAPSSPDPRRLPVLTDSTQSEAAAAAATPIQQPIHAPTAIAAGGPVEVIAGHSVLDADPVPADKALFVAVAGLAADGAGHLFISDSGSNRIRRLDTRTGIVSTVSGTGRLDGQGEAYAVAAQLSTPGALAVDREGRTLFVAEVVARQIKRLDVATGAIEDLGAPKEGWGKPAGMLWTASGLIVSDAGQGQLYRRGADGTWSGILPPKLRLRRGIRTMAQDAKGRVYLSEYFAHRVLRLDPDTGDVEVFAGNGETEPAGAVGEATDTPIRGPDGLAIDAAGRLLVADSGAQRICRIDVETGRLTTLRQMRSGSRLGSWTPGAMAVDAKGTLWMVDSERDRLVRFTPGAAAARTYGQGDIGDGRRATDAHLAHPSSVLADRQGNIYISDTLHHRVRMVDARDGRIRTVAGTGLPGYNGDGRRATDAQLSYPAQIQLDDRQRLYIGDYYNNRVRVVELAEGRIFTLAGTGDAGEEGDGGPATLATLANPHVLYLDGPDALIVTSAVSSSVRRIDLLSGTIESIDTGGVPPTRIIHGVGRWDNGLLLVMPRPMPGSIDLLKEGARRVLFGKPDVSFPYSVAVSPGGDLFICDTGRNRVLRWNRRELSVVVDGLGRPRALAFDAQGHLLIAETFHNRVLRVRLAPAAATSSGQ